jgi:hypothetical protein
MLFYSSKTFVLGCLLEIVCTLHEADALPSGFIAGKMFVFVTALDFVSNLQRQAHYDFIYIDGRACDFEERDFRSLC